MVTRLQEVDVGELTCAMGVELGPLAVLVLGEKIRGVNLCRTGAAGGEAVGVGGDALNLGVLLIGTGLDGLDATGTSGGTGLLGGGGGARVRHTELGEVLAVVPHDQSNNNEQQEKDACLAVIGQKLERHLRNGRNNVLIEHVLQTRHLI